MHACTVSWCMHACMPDDNSISNVPMQASQDCQIHSIGLTYITEFNMHWSPSNAGNSVVNTPSPRSYVTGHNSDSGAVSLPLTLLCTIMESHMPLGILL